MFSSKDFMKFVKQSHSQSRQIHLVTGAKGADHISHLLHVYHSVGVVDGLLKEKKITEEEGQNLKSMLNSPDRDNTNIADMIIKQLI